jgi:hypothetical protein
MTASVFQSVLCPTDFSEASIPTFAHALRIAIGSRSELHLLNVARYAALDHAPLPLSTTPCTTTPPTALPGKLVWRPSWPCLALFQGHQSRPNAQHPTTLGDEDKAHFRRFQLSRELGYAQSDGREVHYVGRRRDRGCIGSV